jgi:hypothetical protein
MCINQLPNYLSRRSSSAWAKNALASLRISLALRSSLTSRSSSLTRSRSALVTPSRTPVSTSCLRTQSFNVYGTQPIFGAIDSIVAHNDEYSPRCSSTILTARSRTSGENLFGFFIAPFSQIKEPPQFPGRFKTWIHYNRARLARQIVGAYTRVWCSTISQGSAHGNGLLACVLCLRRERVVIGRGW